MTEQSLGYVGIVVWTISFLISAPNTNEAWVHEIATAAGYGSIDPREPGHTAGTER
jgi:hypothetical protein